MRITKVMVEVTDADLISAKDHSDLLGNIGEYLRTQGFEMIEPIFMSQDLPGRDALSLVREVLISCRPLK